jgi:hypothetical protein
MLGPGSIRSPKRKPETKSYILDLSVNEKKRKRNIKSTTADKQSKGKKIGTSQLGYPKEQAFQQNGSGKKIKGRKITQIQKGKVKKSR